MQETTFRDQPWRNTSSGEESCHVNRSCFCRMRASSSTAGSPPAFPLIATHREVAVVIDIVEGCDEPEGILFVSQLSR